MYLIEVTLVNSKGEQSQYSQLVYVIKPEKQEETKEVSEEVGDQDESENKEITEKDQNDAEVANEDLQGEINDEN